MRLPKLTTVKSAEEARSLAIEWQYWATEQSLSIGELSNYQAYFETLATRFNLTNEFAENGII